MEEQRGSLGCLVWSLLGSIVALIALADLLLGFELIPGIDLGGGLAALIRLIGGLIELLTSPF